MFATPVAESDADAPRRRPNPGYRVAPPVTDAFTPWVSALDDDLAHADYEWVLVADGTLVPQAVDETDATVRPKRSRWRRR